VDSSKLKRVTLVAQEFARQHFCWLESLKYEDVPGTLPILICNNFFDMALLNWAHLFGNLRDDLHFKKVLSDPESFKSKIQNKLSMDQNGWENHWKSLKDFRDQRVAHIDPVESSIVPDLEIAFKCICEYYDVAKTELKAQQQTLSLDSYHSLQDFVERNADYYSTHIAKVFNAIKI
jgi:hypothetical protein